MEEVARLKEQLEDRSKQYDDLKSKLEYLESTGGNNFATQELEAQFKNQIEHLNQEKDDHTRRLHERMKMLVSGHNSVLEQKKVEHLEMKSKLKQHETVIESLHKEKKIATINQQKNNTAIQEMYCKILQAEAEISSLNDENQSLKKELKLANEKIKEFESEYIRVLNDKHSDTLSTIKQGKLTEEVTGTLEKVCADIVAKF